jgi:hypothetical protein
LQPYRQARTVLADAGASVVLVEPGLSLPLLFVDGFTPAYTCVRSRPELCRRPVPIERVQELVQRRGARLYHRFEPRRAGPG